MFLLLFFVCIFQLTFAAQVPICKTVRHTGAFNDAYLSTLYNFSFDISVTTNPQNASYPNTVVVTNFMEWFLNSTVFNRLSPWSFVLYDKVNKSVECPTMTENCVIQFPNGQQRYYFDFSYKNKTDSYKFVLGPQIFVNDGTFFDGVSGIFWDPQNLFHMVLNNNNYSEADLSLIADSYCTAFEYINIPDTTNEMCTVFEFHSTISVPNVSNKMYVNAEIQVTNTSFVPNYVSFQNAPDQNFIQRAYILDPKNEITSRNLSSNFQYEFLFDYDSAQRHFDGIFLGELIGRNGIFFKNQNQPFTSADPCWYKNSTVPFTNATYASYFCCVHFDGDTTSTPTTTPQPPSPTTPVSDGITTICSSDTTQAWLDIIYIVDTSNAMDDQNLKTLSGEIATQLEGFTLGQNGLHTTRVAIILYATDITVYYKLEDTTTYEDLYKMLKNISNYANPTDGGGSLNDALLKALNMIPHAPDNNMIRHRIPIIVLFVAAYNQDGFSNADQTAKRIRDDGGTIVVINYDSGNNQLAYLLLNSIVSAGYYYNSTEEFSLLTYAFTQINCVCPPGWTQYHVNNTGEGRITKYADCYWSDGAVSSANIANDLSCDPGHLISLPNWEIFNFTTDQILPHNRYIKGAKYLSISLHKSDDGTWKWWGYNGIEQLPYDDFPKMSQTPAPNDTYGYMWRFSGLQWKLLTGHNLKYQFICQQKACDAEFSCNKRQIQ